MPAEQKALLIVEDDPTYAAFISSSLGDARLGLRLHHVSTLNDALAYVRGQPPYTDRAAHPFPAIVLLDINLSHDNGFPVLKFLNDHGYLKDEKTRVIMLTASGRPEDIRQAL